MAMRMTVTWRGDPIKRDTREAAAKGLTDGCEHWLQRSREVVPIEEGTLERSGVATVDRAELVGAVSYDTPYAVRQHEDLNLRHDPGRTAKYLERPMHEERNTINALIAAAVRRALS